MKIDLNKCNLIERVYIALFFIAKYLDEYYSILEYLIMFVLITSNYIVSHCIEVNINEDNIIKCYYIAFKKVI